MYFFKGRRLKRETKLTYLSIMILLIILLAKTKEYDLYMRMDRESYLGSQERVQVIFKFKEGATIRIYFEKYEKEQI